MRCLVVLLTVSAFLMSGCDTVSHQVNRPPGSVAMVLLDVSKSTKRKAIRDRYLNTFELVLDEMDAINDDGSYLGGDAIDDNPLAHGGLPIKADFEPCGLLDNSRSCEADLAQSAERVLDETRRLAEDTSDGTDIMSGLRLAETYLGAYNEGIPERLIVLSDMVQSNGPFGVKQVLRESRGEIARRIQATNLPDLYGVEVYVVGAGATAPDKLKAGEIARVQAFWREYFDESGAELVFYGPALPDFPL